MHDQETNAQSRGLKTEKSDPKARTTPKRNTTDEGIIWRLEPFDFREAHRNAISYFSHHHADMIVFPVKDLRKEARPPSHRSVK
jgi:hypothetical protein